MKKIEYQIVGIDCDNCDWRDHDVSIADMHNHVGRLCPVCGKDVLTQVDYDIFMNAVNTINTVNNMDQAILENIANDLGLSNDTATELSFKVKEGRLDVNMKLFKYRIEFEENGNDLNTYFVIYDNHLYQHNPMLNNKSKNYTFIIPLDDNYGKHVLKSELKAAKVSLYENDVKKAYIDLGLRGIELTDIITDNLLGRIILLYKNITTIDDAVYLNEDCIIWNDIPLTEDILVELGFSKNVMAGTGWNSINSMCDAIYYYKNGRITINATTHWTWFLDTDQRNDIAVHTKQAMIALLKTYNLENEI